MTSAVEFLERHLPARAAAWELQALEALTAHPRPLMPWPWASIRLVPDPTIPPPGSLVRLSADLGFLDLSGRSSGLLSFRVCADLKWLGMLIPEKESYALIVESFSVVEASKRKRAHIPELPLTPSPGYTFADAASSDWHVPMLAGDTVTISFRNTGDSPIRIRISGTCLVFRTS